MKTYYDKYCVYSDSAMREVIYEVNDSVTKIIKGVEYYEKDLIQVLMRRHARTVDELKKRI